MKKTMLGRSGLEVTKLTWGAMELRGNRIWGGRKITDDDAKRILYAVLDSGVNFIDTSYCYGTSEYYIGKYLSEHRKKFYLASKCCCVVRNVGKEDDTPHIYDKNVILYNIDESLRRLKTDYLDLYQLHNPPFEVYEREHLLEVMKEIVATGKVRHIGVSTILDQGLVDYMNTNEFEAFQIPYSAFEREHENIITEVSKSGAGTIIRGGVNRGEPGVSGEVQWHNWDLWDQANLDELKDPDEDRTAFLLRFALSHPYIDTLNIGTLNPEHLKNNIRSIEKGPLKADVYEETKRRLDALGERSK